MGKDKKKKDKKKKDKKKKREFKAGKKLCKLGKHTEEYISRYAQLVVPARYLCVKCGRVAACDDNTCEPYSL